MLVLIISFLTVFNPLLATAEPLDTMQSDFSYSISELPGSRPGYDNVYSDINLTTLQMTQPWTRRHSVSSKADKFRPDYTESHSRTPPWEPQNSHTTLRSSYKIQGQILNFFSRILFLCVCVCVCVCACCILPPSCCTKALFMQKTGSSQFAHPWLLIMLAAKRYL